MQRSIFALSFVTAFLLIACNKPAEQLPANQNQSSPQPSERSLTAKEVIEAFQAAGIPITSVIYYTPENDQNELMSRPHQYTEKASWADKRIKQEPDYNPAHKGSKVDLDPEGGTVEIFTTQQDLESRKQYVEAIGAKLSPLAEYTYTRGNALVRLRKQLTPTQAAEYERVLKGMQ